MATSFYKNFFRSQFIDSIPNVKNFAQEDLSTKTYIIVGASAGLGRKAARHLYRLGASRIILTVRNEKKGAAAKEYIEAPPKNTKPKASSSSSKPVIELWSLDLNSFASIKAFSERVNTELDRIDGVLLNAGVQTEEFWLSPEGWESTLQVNYLSITLLALLLLPRLYSVAETYNITPHLSFVSSDTHILASLADFPEDKILQQLNRPENSTGPGTYPRSKLLQALMVRELADKTDAQKVIINAVNPGLCHSEMTSAMTPSLFQRAVLKVVARSTRDGATCLVHGLIGARKSSHGRFLNSCEESLWSSYVFTDEGYRQQKGLYEETMDVLAKACPEVEDVFRELSL